MRYPWRLVSVNRIENYRFRFRSWLGYHPWFFRFLVTRWRTNLADNHGRTCGKDTDIVVEAFPRSANTYVVAYFKYAMEDSLTIASHRHAGVQFRFAKRYGVPSLCIIRNPVDAILSLKIRRPGVEIDLLVKEYAQFHKFVEKYLDSILLVSFEQVIESVSSVVEELNRKFLSDYPIVEVDDNIRDELFSIVEAMDKKDRTYSRKPQGAETENMVARPSLNRANHRLREEYINAILASSFYAEAKRVYDDLMNRSLQVRSSQ